MPPANWSQQQAGLRALGARQASQQKPIGLLSYLGQNTMSSTLPNNPLGTQTTTPTTMGITAKTPSSNIQTPPKTLPSGMSNPQGSPSLIQQNVSATSSNTNPAGSAGNQYTQDASGKWVLGGTPTPPPAPTPAPAPAPTPTPTPTATPAPNTNQTGVQTPYSATNPPTSFPGLMGAAIGQAQGYYNNQQGLTQQAQDLISKIKGEQTATTGQFNGTASDEAGRIATLQGLENSGVGAIEAQQAKQAGYESPLTSLYGTSIGATAPQLAGYNQQVFNPLTGQMGSGNGGGASGSAMSQLPQQAQSAIQSYAQQVQNGSMTRAGAEGRLGAYGQPGLNALNEALGSNFNTNASNASAGTTAQGQQIQTAAQSTNAALDTLGSAFSSLPGFETGGIPATNSIAQWVASQFGSQALQQYKTNLADARSQLIGVLNSSGGTPTGNEATANQYLPDNMTKAQFDANVGTAQNPGIVRQLVQQKVNAFTQSGQQSGGQSQNQNANTNSNIFSW